MDLHDAERLARKLMAEHAPGWKFEWDRAKKRYGCTHYGHPKRITLSRPLTELRTQEQVERTIKHELAHVLAGAKAGHGPVWRAHARALGIPAVRCSNDVSIPGAWVGTCPHCLEQFTKHRKPKRDLLYACPKCCRKYARGRWDARFILIWTKKK